MKSSRPGDSPHLRIVAFCAVLGVLAVALPAAAAIPAAQRTALVDLYNSTAGSNWLNRSGWLGATGTECTWYGVTCDVEQTTVRALALPSNRLNGKLPSSLGNLSGLMSLIVSNNQLYGALPSTLASANLLQTLKVQGNWLGGVIPENYTILVNLTTLDIRWNALHTTDPTLTTFLNSKQPGWDLTQTVAPTNIAATNPTTTSITVTWTPIAYTADSGYYNVLYCCPFSSVGMITANKSASSLVVSSLDPGRPYRFGVQTITTPHANNGNTVYSNIGGLAEISTLCDYTPTPSSLSVGSRGPTPIAFEVQPGSFCKWRAVADDSWLTVTTGSPFQGYGVVRCNVAANTGPARTGTITIEEYAPRPEGSAPAPSPPVSGKLTVNQESGCVYALNPHSRVIGTSGGSGLTFQVQSGAGCPWTATSDASWITITEGASGTGTATVTYQVSPNPGAARSGTIIAAGQTFTVNQTPCPISVGPPSLPAAQVDQPYSTRVSASGGEAPYQFHAANLPTWLTLGEMTGELTGTPPSTGAFSFTLEAFDARGCEGTRSYQVTVEGCTKPGTPAFTSVPGGAIPAGAPFTAAWTPVLPVGTGGRYEVEVGVGQNCANPLYLTVREPVITVPTQPGLPTVYCVTVTAVDGSGCRGNPSRREQITTRLPRPGFALIGQVPTSQAQRAGPPDQLPRVLVRNLGAETDSLTLSGVSGFFEANPPFVPDVAPGEDAVLNVRFAPEATSTAGLRTGNLGANWDEGRLAAPVFLTVLDRIPGGAEGVKLSYASSNEVHFRKAGEGNPPSQEIRIVNTGDRPGRLAPRIGPGGAWLSVDGDFTSPLPGGSTRTFVVSVDRTKRTSVDGAPPLVTNLVFQNVDGWSEDAAHGQVFDEEPPIVESGQNRPALPADDFSLLIGSVVSAEGLGARFVSDAWIRNRGASNVDATLYFTPNGKDGVTDAGVLKSTITIRPFSTYRLSDLVKGIFGLDGVSGQVEIRSANLPQLSVRSTADAITTKESGIVRYGSEIPIVLSGQGARGAGSGAKASTQAATDWMGILTALRDPAAGFRTNVILAETAGAPATVRILLYNKDGVLVGQKSVGLAPYSKQQINASDTELFPEGKPFDGGSAEILPEGGTGAVAAFATIIDNRSGSYATRRAETFQVTAASGSRRTVVPRAAGTMFLPAVTRSEALNNSFYTTRLALTNLARVPVKVQLTYLPDSAVGGEPVTKEVVVPERAEGPKAIVWEDILGTLFEVTANSSGMMRFVADEGALSIASETSTPIELGNPAKGRSVSAVNPAPGKAETEPLGVFSLDSPEVVGTALSGSPRAVVTHPAIEEGFAYRTNLILAELAGESIVVKVRVVMAGTEGVSLGEKSYAIAPFQRLQRNKVVREVVGLGPDDPSAEFKDIELQIEAVSGDGRALAIVTKIDNNPASKRTDIFTLGGAVGGSPVGFGN